jgi:solute carrier family 25 (mitochondrial folate transporter), member 32
MIQTTTELIAGLTAGSVSTLVMHPLDVIKVKLQVTPGKGHFLSEVVKLLFKEGDANLKLQPVQMYRGLSVNVLGNGISWGLYFMVNHELLKLYSDFGGERSGNAYFSCALLSGISTSFMTNPIWVLKTRILSTRADQGPYSTILRSFKYVYTRDGLRGFWAGFFPGLFGIAQASVQFSLYQMMRDSRLRESRKTGNGVTESDDGTTSITLSTLEYLGLSASSKIISSSIFYPYQVVRANLQVDARTLNLQHYTSAFQVIESILSREGLLGLYKGLGPNLLRVVPATCITFIVYEKMKHFLE